MAVVAERAFTSRSTLQRIEAGDTSVSIGIYAAVLHALSLLDGLSQVADISNDRIGPPPRTYPSTFTSKRSAGTLRDS
jgi:hypothetical protein